MKTSLVIPVFSVTREMLEMAKRCVSSLDGDRPDEVIVVDDASWLAFERSEKVDKLLRNDKNLGYVRTVNAGLKVAVGDVLIVGNSDLVFSEGWQRAITRPLATHDICSLRLSDTGEEGTEDRLEEHGRFNALFAMKRSTYEKLGPLDERYVHFCADNDYRRRAINAGLKMCVNHGFRMEHVGDATYGKIDPEHKSYAIDFATFKSIHGNAD